MSNTGAAGRANPPDVTAILKFLGSGGSIQSRLKETSSGHREFFHGFEGSALRIPDLKLGAPELIGLLQDMESNGFICREERVHPHDFSEYLVRWMIVETKV